MYYRGCAMSEKMTVLNIRISSEEKEEIKTRAEKKVSVSSYARNLLFLEYNAKDIQDNTVVIQEKMNVFQI